jgi:hypothetical protein
MSDEIYFEGDPATDSARRHLERVLKEPERRRWPWYLAMFAGGTAFAIWHFQKRRRNGTNSSEDGSGPARPAS